MQQQNLAPKWRPLNAFQRRVVGVLVEKAKTTPDAYPLTLNALTNGCKQKSNRSPQMDIASDDVELTLDELRQMGAATEIQGSGRVPKAVTAASRVVLLPNGRAGVRRRERNNRPHPVAGRGLVRLYDETGYGSKDIGFGSWFKLQAQNLLKVVF